jgi:hypothetical protein
MRLKRLSAQSTAEYAVILAIVIGAAVAMQVYFRRGLQARTKAGVDAFTGINQEIMLEGGGTANFSALSQYEPYYAEIEYQRYQESVEQEHMGEGKIKKEKVSDFSATRGYQVQKTAVGKAAADEKWQ